MGLDVLSAQYTPLPQIPINMLRTRALVGLESGFNQLSQTDYERPIIPMNCVSGIRLHPNTLAIIQLTFSAEAIWRRRSFGSISKGFQGE